MTRRVWRHDAGGGRAAAIAAASRRRVGACLAVVVVALIATGRGAADETSPARAREGGRADRGSAAAAAGPALVAVASNFTATARELAEAYAERTGARIELTFGATGKHYAQVVAGAPFDALLAADAERPARLEREGRAVAGTRFTYAVGRLVLWSPDPGRVDPAGTVLDAGKFGRLALAKPELAPYGAAAREVLEARGLWAEGAGPFVFGQNVAQAMQFAQSGGADMAFVARAQVVALPEARRGSTWQVPASLHAPIVQDAILLRENAAARGFHAFLRTEEARAMIAAAGYDAPPASPEAAPPVAAAEAAPPSGDDPVEEGLPTPRRDSIGRP